MAKNIELLLVESVENLGLVGEVVRVRAGYARNYLLPLGMAEFPTEERIAELQSARVEAAAKADALREEQESILGKLGGIVLTLRRPTNDKGILYGSVSQRDISDALIQGGFNVGISAVRLSVAIRRTGNYEVPIQFGKELREVITVVVESESIIEEMADDAVEESVDPAVDSEMDAPAVDAAEVASDES
ncbi:MAG: 50S ribosomal protein L9 [Planctomycetota bacterium]|nr:50S ribosomal protein L9 [Planctomycetota bacterium]MEC8412414.1 50S ribosomal protein L9 [Planctomycetota bacterium]